MALKNQAEQAEHDQKADQENDRDDPQENFHHSSAWRWRWMERAGIYESSVQKRYPPAGGGNSRLDAGTHNLPAAGNEGSGSRHRLHFFDDPNTAKYACQECI